MRDACKVVTPKAGFKANYDCRSYFWQASRLVINCFCQNAYLFVHIHVTDFQVAYEYNGKLQIANLVLSHQMDKFMTYLHIVIAYGDCKFWAGTGNTFYIHSV